MEKREVALIEGLGFKFDVCFGSGTGLGDQVQILGSRPPRLRFRKHPHFPSNECL